MSALLPGLCVLCTALATAVDGAAESRAAFERLKALEGEWAGTYEWSGARSGSGPIEVTYALTGNGTAVVETLVFGEDGTVTMTTIYHRDGDDLRATHYCARGNQPRLRATSVGADGRAITFGFVDVTGMTGPDDAHVNGIESDLTADDRVTLTLTFKGTDGDSRERIALRRAGPAKDAAEAVGETVSAFYTLISGPAGERDWPALRARFLDEAFLGSLGADQPTVRLRPLAEWFPGVQEYLRENPLFENETSRCVSVLGDVAQVLSRVESRKTPDGDPFQISTNLLQLRRAGGAWRVATWLTLERAPDASATLSADRCHALAQ